jgi:hypothetical protein
VHPPHRPLRYGSALLSLCIAALLLLPLRAVPASAEGSILYLPYVQREAGVSSGDCPATSTQQYADGTAYQYDSDNPVRLAELHADKNLDLRGYAANSNTALRTLVNYGTDDPTQPPQFATLFSPTRVPAIAETYRVYNWNWAASPAPGSRGSLLTTWPVTALGLSTTAGEVLRVPTSGYNIGQGYEVMVIYADADTIALRYTREDSSGSQGYTVHVDNVCVDVNLLALYNDLDAADGPRYKYPNSSYDLPVLAAGQRFGTARTETIVAIVDTGNFMDPRSSAEWWQVRS